MKEKISELNVSVIIPTKNEGPAIQGCLSSVFNQSLKPLEVIVVDGRSSDDTVTQAQQFDVKVITETEPASLPNARNLGVKNAKGEIILIIDETLPLTRIVYKMRFNILEIQM